MSGDATWMNRPSDRLDEHDARCARAEAGLLPTLADLARPRCASCRGDLSLGQYATDGQPWCPRCEPERAKPASLCACGEPAVVWLYPDGAALPLCHRCFGYHEALK